MANETTAINAELRTETGKGSARRARRAGKIPAVLFGKGFDPVHVDLPSHDTFLLVKDSANAIVNVHYGESTQLCLVKSIQVHPVSRDILHVDLFVISEGQKVEVEVPIILVGEPAPGVQTQQEEFVLPVQAPATHIPEHIEVSVDGLGEGVVIRVQDLELPANVEATLDGERDIVSLIAISDQVVESEADAEAAVDAATEDGSSSSDSE